MLARTLLHQIRVEKRTRTPAEDDAATVIDNDLEPPVPGRLLRAACFHAHLLLGNQFRGQLAPQVGRKVD
jgi:hypothetical protein